MNRPEVKGNILNAATLLPQKHDPSSIGTPYPGYRTVAVQTQSGIKTFVADDQYRMLEYADMRQAQAKPYFEIIPNDPTFVAGSGIPPSSPLPDRPCDRLVLVSGVKQGWHLFAEESSVIQARVASGEFVYLGEL